MGRPIRRARRALTLIELLIVLGVLLAMAALALPAMHEALERRRFEGAVDDVVGSLRLARSHARIEAATVEVLLVEADTGGQWLVARRVDLTELSAVEGDDGDAIEPIAESWARRRIDAELAIDATAAGASDDADQAGSIDRAGAGDDEPRTRDALSEPEPADDGARGRPRRVALFAADGSAPVASTIDLRGADGRVATVRVNPWTGLASLVGAPQRQLDETSPAFPEASLDEPGDSSAAARPGAPREAP